ncbi:MAG: hypothetical protein H6825_10080 [Planctomycetes bacterium]|nr:hypothetical protein [Planctomycetota bacterium]
MSRANEADEGRAPPEEAPFDAAAVRAWLTDEVPALLARIDAHTSVRWGCMTPPQVVEHLEWAMRVALGEVELVQAVPDEALPRQRAFLRSAAPPPRELKLPGLDAPPPLRHASLDAARSALADVTARFLRDGCGDRRPVHPLFGPMDADDWLRLHAKHVRHHLGQLGLVD